MNASLQKYRNWEVYTEGAPAKLHFPHRIFKGWSRTGLFSGKNYNEADSLAPAMQAFLPGISVVNKAFMSKKELGHKQCAKKWVKLFPRHCKHKVL